MYDFDSLLDEVLKNRPELTRDQIMAQIQEKKQNIGSGFLTDQGALFLIAGELGVQLTHMTSTDLTLKDIYAGANDITIVARILAIYPVSEFKKKDGSVGRYRRLSLFDKSNVSRLTIWDDNEGAIKLEGMSVDTPVRISNGYVRPGLDGKPSLNLGKRGKIEVLSDENLVSRLTPLSKLTRKVGEVEEEQNIPAVEGTASSASRSSNFTRSDGSPGSLAQFELTGDAGKDRIRVVIWNPVGIEVSTGQTVMVTNLRVKKSANGRELHGDSGSVVQDLGSVAVAAVRASPKFVKVNRVKDLTGRVNLEVMALSKASTHDVPMRDGPSMKKAELIIGDDTGEITVVGWREMADRLAEVEVGQKVRVFDVARQVSKMGMVTLELETGSRIEKVSD
jgi:ssDNA-binding replication factor A large subunit